MQAEQPVASEKTDKPVTSDKAKKLTAIFLCFVVFACIAFAVTIFSVLSDILPKHYIWYMFIQGVAHIITFKVSKKIMLNYRSIEFTDSVGDHDSFNCNGANCTGFSCSSLNCNRATCNAIKLYYYRYYYGL